MDTKASKNAPGKVRRLRPRRLPTTVDEAVERLMRWLSDEQLDTIARRKHTYYSREPGDQVSTRMLSMAIRNEFGLWSDKSPLRDATGKAHPDDASAVIMRALWRRLKKERRTP
jgi:hypothetical protein